MSLEFRCRDVGVVCNAKATAESPEQLVEKVREHARDAHGVELTETLIDFAVTKAKQTGRKG